MYYLIALPLIPIGLFELGKYHLRREIRKNIIALENMKVESDDEITSLIELHFAELKKI
tara:strand:+ start:330 stop:506 length:177 start_codon:yes stop_codon:yes gene_type:complete